MPYQDREIAAALRSDLAALNRAITEAVNAGLRVECAVMDTKEMRDRWDRPMITVTISRPIE